MTDNKFNEWLKKCDKIVSRKAGLGLDDLPDAMWRDYFDDGLTPIDATDSAYEDQWQDDIPIQVWNR
jgi:hypothetical protein